MAAPASSWPYSRRTDRTQEDRVPVAVRESETSATYSRTDAPAAGPRIVFLLMSAVAPQATVDQLAASLAPHTVLVHHDFSQTPVFQLASTNVRWVPQPRRTGWANFGFVEGIFHSMRHALEHLEFDYLQLLSPTCLPIRPMREFESHVSGPCGAHFDAIDLVGNIDALMSVGYRAFTPEGAMRHRLLRRLSGEYFGQSQGRRDVAGVWLRTGHAAGLLPWIARAVVHAFRHPVVGRHVFREPFHPYYGSTWFGARRKVIADMTALFSRPEIHSYFSRLHIADEFLIPTMLKHLGVHQGPSNHLIQRYEGAHTGRFEVQDIEQLRQSGAYFARKFADEASAPLREKVLRELAGKREPWSGNFQL